MRLRGLWTAAINVVLAVVGYDLIHHYERWAAYLFAVVFLTVRLLTMMPHHLTSSGHLRGSAQELGRDGLWCIRFPKKLTRMIQNRFGITNSRFGFVHVDIS